MDDIDQYMFPFEERPRGADDDFVELSLAHRPRSSAVLAWSRASLSYTDNEPAGDGASSAAWSVRPRGGRPQCGLARGRRASHRIEPVRPARDPNRDCRVFIDYAGDGLYAMTMQYREEPPVVLERSANAADLVFGAGAWLQPGLRASVSEAAMTAALLGFQVWSPKELLRNERDLGRNSRVKVLLDGPEVERVAEVGFRYRAVSSRWAYSAFGPFLSKKQLRMLWKREGLQERKRGRDQGDA
jgi:hypothetical protein